MANQEATNLEALKEDAISISWSEKDASFCQELLPPPQCCHHNEVVLHLGVEELSELDLKQLWPVVLAR